MLKQTFLTAAAVLGLAACASGPDYRPVPASASAASPFLSAIGPAITAAQPAGNWWRLYRDPVLDRLIADALAANTDIRVAAARLARARALLRETRGAREPQVGVGGSAQGGRLPGPAMPGEPRTDLAFDVGLDVAYELDLFGRLSRSVEAARGDVGAAAADANAARVAIVAETVRAYADAASFADRIAVAQRIAALLDQSLALTERRHQVGLANGLDTARNAALRDQRQAEVPLLTAQRDAALFRLATLTGRTPRELPAEAGARTSPPRVEQAIPVGDGTALLARLLGGPTSARPSGGWQRRPPGSGSRPPTFTPA